MNFSDIYNHCVEGMKEAKRQYDENSHMMHNARQDDIDYHDWPQYTEQFSLKARWNTLREIKEMLIEWGNPKSEQLKKEFEEVFGSQL